MNINPDTFLMSDLAQGDTGLPFVVWISTGMLPTDDARIWVSPGNKFVSSQLATVALNPDVRVIEGQISADDLSLLHQWIEINRDIIEGHWTGKIPHSADAIVAIRRVQ